MEEDFDFIVFTDGASKGNPGPGGWGAIVACGAQFLDSKKNTPRIQELGGRQAHTTNNRMEVTAAIQALDWIQNMIISIGKIEKKYSVKIYTDSNYLINGITKWVYGWQKNNWITISKQQVSNRDLWEKLISFTFDFAIKWQYVGGHVGIPANERVDKIAETFALNRKIDLFAGLARNYQIKDVLDLDFDKKQKKIKDDSRARSRFKAYSYVSLVGGKVAVHKTWAQCEARVKGKSGAKYKKTQNESEERKLMSEWQKKSA